MGDNSSLNTSKILKDDEFYTTYEEIESEVMYYEHCFEGKSVYCNTDGEDSNFWKFFVNNFDRLKLRRLVATHLEEPRSYMLEYVGDGAIRKYMLVGNGDYSSPECIQLLSECDIVVTNPPFSIYKEYIPYILDSYKQYLVIGNMNALTSHTFFPYFLSGRVNLGFTKPRYFMTPKGNRVRFGIAVWFTNLHSHISKQPIPLTRSYEVDPDFYEHFDNYNAINTEKTIDIPYDYDGVIGVPISFLNRYCPEQFRILASTDGTRVDGIGPTKRYIHPVMHRPDGTIGDGTKMNSFGAIRCDPDTFTGCYYTADNVSYPLRGVFKRLLVKRL